MNIFEIIRARIAHYEEQNAAIKRHIDALIQDAYTDPNPREALANIHSKYDALSLNDEIIAELTTLAEHEQSIKLVA